MKTLLLFTSLIFFCQFSLAQRNTDSLPKVSEQEYDELAHQVNGFEGAFVGQTQLTEGQGLSFGFGMQFEQSLPTLYFSQDNGKLKQRSGIELDGLCSASFYFDIFDRDAGESEDAFRLVLETLENFIFNHHIEAGCGIRASLGHYLKRGGSWKDNGNRKYFVQAMGHVVDEIGTNDDDDFEDGTALSLAIGRTEKFYLDSHYKGKESFMLGYKVYKTKDSGEKLEAIFFEVNSDVF